MKTCEKCGERIKDSEAITWEEGPKHTYICPECFSEEENFEDENKQNQNKGENK